jgi:hypothetical protein
MRLPRERATTHTTHNSSNNIGAVYLLFSPLTLFTMPPKRKTSSKKKKKGTKKGAAAVATPDVQQSKDAPLETIKIPSEMVELLFLLY